MAERGTKPLSHRDLAELHKISDVHLIKWEAEGVEIRDTREVVRKIWGLQRKPPNWVEVFTRLAEGESDDTHEGWKKRKTIAEVKLKETALSKARGESFDRKDGEQVMAAIASALNLRLTEMQAMIPPQLEGLDASGIEIILGKEIQKIREDLADLESQLWARVYETYIPANTQAPADSAVGGNRKAAAKAQRVEVV
jgi:hypothetical protein